MAHTARLIARSLLANHTDHKLDRCSEEWNDLLNLSSFGFIRLGQLSQFRDDF